MAADRLRAPSSSITGSALARHRQKGHFVKSLSHIAASALLIAFVSGCASTGTSVNESTGAVKNAYETGRDSKVLQPWVCATAGALLAGALASTENRESAAIGALVGGGLGWWACRSMVSPLPDEDKDGVPDRVDLCPGTPAGTRVSANGCDVNIDTDGDGVPDTNDQCAATPKGATVNSVGCEPNTDTDGDGVPNDKDLCPETMPGVRVMANGCEEDSDGDGVPDGLDRCDATPRGVKVGPDGCAVDTDGDGIFDMQDRCPGTKPGTKVDANGCEVAAAAPQPNAPITADMTLTGVTFESGSAKIAPESFAALDAVAARLKANPGVKVEIAGHTDNSGLAETNRALSQRRAEMVMTYLVSKGVPAANITARGYGSDKPVADNASADGRAQNRRVELRLVN